MTRKPATTTARPSLPPPKPGTRSAAEVTLHVELPNDPELRKQILDLLEKERGKLAIAVDPRVTGYPQYVFDPLSSRRRGVGEVVSVRNAFEQRNGTIVEQLTESVFAVKIFDDLVVVVHEPESAWRE